MKKLNVLLIALWLTAAGVSHADSQDELSKQNAELRKRVDKMEKELADLKATLMQQAKTSETEAKAVESQKPEKAAAGMKIDAAEKKPVWSNLDIQLYGYIKLDAAYDTSRVDTGDYARWVESESDNEDDDQFNMTARETRLGALISGPEDDELKTSGRVEIDFYEGGAENKPRVMMRHAYLNILWPEDRFSILAGQTADVISPLYPSTINYTVGWWAGNIGYRRPQIRLTKDLALSQDVDLKLEGALARTIGISDTFTTDSGADAGYPGLQGRAAITFPWFGYKPTTLGVSGHVAREEYDTSASGDSKHFDSWSANLDVTQPINEWLTIKGEMFTGENLSAYLGGIGQGVNIDTFKEIGSNGGWIAAALGPWDKWQFNVGLSAEDVDGDDLRGMSGDKRTYNRSIFGNMLYSLNNSTQIGFELSQWRTDYQGQDDGDSVRAQGALIYRF
ncbi:MAG TPA: hypothetical protein VMX13_11730 [Sedimentisphaerales bacterium]|nr:hypothetical protein [Sedimentisphaerales bacterium]